mmetsp:Transcript_9428/g.26815  ORF Transcript_9428/g.26815 Transcript_9428/m.26815 type:complete len:211 (-) Transcript_9428:374-1006(-)
MKVGAITRVGLHRVAERVPQVQKRPYPSLLLVLGNHFGLDGAAPLNGRRDRPAKLWVVAVHQALDVLLEPPEEVRVPDEAVLDDLRHPRGSLSVRQGLEGQRVHENALRLVEGPYHVLPEGMVHTRLPADGAIHHRHHRRWDLYEVHPPLEGRGREACHVTDHSASQCNESGLPVEPQLHRFVPNLHELLGRFVLLSVPENDALHLKTRV